MPRPPTRYSGPALTALSAREAVALLSRGDVTPDALLEAAWARMDAVEPAINATVIRNKGWTLAQRARLPKPDGGRGWLAGLPVAIKDLIAVAGLPNTAGSAALADFVPDENDALIDRLLARGAVISGKTNTPEFGAGANTFNAVFGATRNPWDTGRNAGGSSGGSAAALATGEAWLAHGSDLAGSLRTPAAFCGVVGLRTTPGRAGGAPPDTAFALEAVQGPMARDIADTALFLDAMTGFDARHPLSLEPPEEGFQAALTRNPGPMRIAFSEDQGGFAPVEAEIRTVLRQAMTTAAGPGFTVEDACPVLPDLDRTYAVLRGLHYGAVLSKLPDAIRAEFKETLAGNVAFALTLSADAIFEAMRARTRIYHIMRRFLDNYDVLAIPVTGLAPGPVEEEYPRLVDGVPMGDYIEWLRFSFLAPTAMLPALSMPVGFTEAGMPVGVQLIGPPRGEARLLQVAAALEARLGLPTGPIDPRTPG